MAEDAALYWIKESCSLEYLIDEADSMSEARIIEMGNKAKKRILANYSWKYIANQYKDIFH